MNTLVRAGGRPLAALFVAVLVAAPLQANHGGGSQAGSGAGDGEGSGTGGGLQLASEAIGTLPTWWVDDGAPLVSMPQADQTPWQLDAHLEVVVPAHLLETFVADATGEGYVFLSLPPALDDVVRVRFFGDVRVDLEREVVQSNGLPLSLRVGADNLGGLGALEVGGALGPLFELAPPGGAYDVPLGTSPAFDALFGSEPVRLFTVAPDDATASGWDVGRIEVEVASAHYRFDQTVIDSLLP
jgi:hypothetical protein